MESAVEKTMQAKQILAFERFTLCWLVRIGVSSVVLQELGLGFVEW